MDDTIDLRIKALEKCISEKIVELQAMQKELHSLKAERRESTHPLEKKRKQRPLSDKWIVVLEFIGQHRATDYEEIMEFVKDRHLPISRSSLRGQICWYSRKKWIEKNPQYGFLSLTEEGAKICGYKPRYKADPPPAGNKEEEIPF